MNCYLHKTYQQQAIKGPTQLYNVCFHLSQKHYTGPWGYIQEEMLWLQSLCLRALVCAFLHVCECACGGGFSGEWLMTLSMCACVRVCVCVRVGRVGGVHACVSHRGAMTETEFSYLLRLIYHMMNMLMYVNAHFKLKLHVKQVSWPKQAGEKEQQQQK